MDSILVKLFLGEINPSEDNTVLSDEGYQKAIKRQEKLTKEMEKTFTPEQMELLREYSTEDGKVSYAVAKHNFMLGFRLGCKLMAAALR